MSRLDNVLPNLSGMREGEAEQAQASTIPGGLIRPVGLPSGRMLPQGSGRRRSVVKDVEEFLTDVPDRDKPLVEMPAWPTPEEWNAFEPLHLAWEQLMCGFPTELRGTCKTVIRELCNTAQKDGGWNIPPKIVDTMSSTYRGLKGTDDQNARAAIRAALEMTLRDPDYLISPVKEGRTVQTLGLKKADGSPRNFNPATLPAEFHINRSRFVKTKIKISDDDKYWPKIDRIDMKIDVVGYSRQTRWESGKDTEKWIKDANGEPLRRMGANPNDPSEGRWIKNPNYGKGTTVDPSLEWGVVHFYGTRRFTTNFEEVMDAIQGKHGLRRALQPKVRTMVFHFSIPMQALLFSELHFDANQEDILPSDLVWPPGMCPRSESEAEKKAKRELAEKNANAIQACKKVLDKGGV